MYSTTPSKSMPSKQEQAPENDLSAEEFLGMVKSYNARRGFGFVACSQTALKFGRDVYIAKAEASLAFAEGSTAGQIHAQRAAVADKSAPPTLAEEDLIRFRVRLSVEGYPQAEQIQRLRKFQGTIVQPPPMEECAEQESSPVGRIISDELSAVFGQREAVLRRASCGQTRLAAGDRVTFCVQADTGLLRVVPPESHRACACALAAPIPPPSSPDAGCASLGPDARLHAVGERIIVSGLPLDADEAELMRFFAKHGALGAPVAHSRSGGYASVNFPSITEVTRFIARSIHTFADDKETRLARLHARGGCVAKTCASSLPGLPRPMLVPAESPGVLLASWSPVVLAAGYCVEFRPAGVQAQWCKVDASNGRLGGGDSATFDKDCNCCRVVGLPSNAVFEARVSYLTACGCCSCASDCSEWCMAQPQQAAPMSMGHMQLSTVPHCAGTGMASGAPFKFGWLQGPQSMGMPQPHQMVAPGAEAWQQAGAWQTPMQPMHQPQQQQKQQQTAGWRCMHGAVLPPPSTPELRAADESGFALLVQWPSITHATAYVVELRESGSPNVERFIRNVPMQAQGSVVELRIGGLRPIGGIGRCYIAQVRSISACGCESEPSPAGMSQPLGAGVAQPPMHQQPQHSPQHSPHQSLPMLSLAAACGISTQSPMTPPAAPVMSPIRSEQAKLGHQYVASPAPTNPSASRACGELPSLLRGARPTVPPPACTATGVGGMDKVAELAAPEVAGNEDCIILD
eukprot:CAMPEP_0177555616 /NCGR_PEP_ID=MMETSP0369-20130122/68631_1 /TAXON_ID=447022 ORGANISM="Scrippsiella hangoei-like, Strain SHHI-4" /NCGR_SAMPLE_ID=MMETSP0369 /ASSEMBLY_ACC=CAM_ASM_000364 /LENGTH=744 /DNA_ID=CAMNT_0019041757 /DNA_START=1 /DNA_END=2236 /DNA_ORIENTATION=+